VTGVTKADRDRINQRLLEEGIDPHDVALDGLTLDGYYAMPRNEKGEIVRLSDSEPFKRWMEWPNRKIALEAYWYASHFGYGVEEQEE